MVRHTKGPWNVSAALTDGVFDTKEDGRYVIGEDNVLVADCYADTAIDVGLPESFAQAQANARLTAAAPDLYDAAKDAFKVLLRLRERGTIGDSPSIRLLSAAIDKVEGR